MTRLLQVDPTAVRRAGALLERVDDDADRLTRQLLGQPLPCWSSPSGRDYRSQTEDLAARVTRTGRAHGQAAEALRSYARALDEAQDLARHGQRLQAEGARRTEQLARSRTGPAMPVLLGPDPGAALVWQGEHAVAEAERLERDAADRAAAVLRSLAAEAPRPGLAARAARVVDDAVREAVAGLVGLPSALGALAGAGYSAMPWHDRQRQQEGRAVLTDAVQVWEQVPPLVDDLTGGRPGIAIGGLLGGWPKRVTAVTGADPDRVKTEGFLNGIAEGELTVDSFAAAWTQAHAARALQDRVLELRGRPAPSVEELLGGPVELALHEQRGGHTLLKHVGASVATLQARLELETLPREVSARRSTFPDLQTAEELVHQALTDHADALRLFAGSDAFGSFDLPSTALAVPAGTVVHRGGAMTPGTHVNVTVVKDGDGLRVLTAFVDDRPRAGGMRPPRPPRSGT